MLNAARVGHRYPTYRYEVSREKIREYAVATGVDDPRSLAEEGDVVAPPTFAACFTLTPRSSWSSDPELGAHPALVHAGQSFEFHRAVHVGDVLHCSASIADIVSRGRTEILTVQVDCADEAGAPVVTSRSTIVFFS